MRLILHIWRQKNAGAASGKMVRYEAQRTSIRDMSMLEMLDVVNEELIAQGRRADRLRARLPRRNLRHRAAS